MLLTDGSDQEIPYWQRDNRHQEKDVGCLIASYPTKSSDETEINRDRVFEIKSDRLGMVHLAVGGRLMADPGVSFPDTLT